MKIKYIDIINSIEALQVLRNSDDIPYGIGLTIEDNFENISKAMESYGKEEQKLIQKYAAKDENGEIIYVNENSFNIEAGKEQEYLQYREELNEHEKEID